MEALIVKEIASKWAERSLWGLLALALVVFFLMNPEKADRWRALILGGLAKVFRALSKAAAKAAVESELGRFLSHRKGQLDYPSVRIKVDWVEDAQDARLQADGELVVRIRRDLDNPRSTLAAFRLALPHVYVPRLRGVMPPPLMTALDLLVMNLLSEHLGNRVPTIFRSEYLDPEVQNDSQVGEQYGRLLDVHRGGLFEQVLMHEFAALSRRLPPVNLPPGLPQELRDFADWIWSRATVQEGDFSTPMIFVREHIKVAFILTSREATKAMGTAPYERRLGRHLAQGAQTIYLMPLLPEQIAFTREISVAFDSDRRVSGGLVGEVLLHRDGRPLHLPLFRFEATSPGGADEALARNLAGFDCEVGELIQFHVHTSDSKSLRADSDFGPIRVPITELGWGFGGSPSRFLATMNPKEGVVIGVDGIIDCSVRKLSSEPWSELQAQLGRPLACEVIEVDRGGDVHVRLILPSGRRDVFGLIEANDWVIGHNQEVELPGQMVEAVLFDVEPSANRALLSRALSEIDDWDAVKRAYPIGTKALATVSRVDGSGLWCTLPPGNVLGHIEAYRLRQAGHELARFLTTVRPGSAYEVVVLKHREGKQRLVLDLARNQSGGAE